MRPQENRTLRDLGASSSEVYGVDEDPPSTERRPSNMLEAAIPVDTDEEGVDAFNRASAEAEPDGRAESDDAGTKVDLPSERFAIQDSRRKLPTLNPRAGTAGGKTVPAVSSKKRSPHSSSLSGRKRVAAAITSRTP